MRERKWCVCVCTYSPVFVQGRIPVVSYLMCVFLFSLSTNVKIGT